MAMWPPNAFGYLNAYAIPNSNANSIVIATCALLSILAIHEILESIIACANKELTSQSVVGFLILRSHSSLSRMLSIFRNQPIDPQGVYHPRDCRCAEEGNDTLPDENACHFNVSEGPVLSWILMKTSVLRGLIILFEVAFLCLALTTSQRTYLQNGRYALTVVGNDFGTPVGEFKNENGKLGCFELFDNKGIRTAPDNINRVTQVVRCTVKLRPVAVTGRSEILNQGRPPPGFEIFVFDFDLSGDKVIITDVEKKRDGAEQYSYWKAPRVGLVEGPIPSVICGQNYSFTRTIEQRDPVPWRERVDKRLREILKDSYLLAYDNRTRMWADADGDLMRMVFYANWTAIPAEFKDEKYGDEHVLGNILKKLVEIQRTNESSPGDTSRIWWSDGTKIHRTSGPVVEYIVTAPLCGLVPWLILTVATLLVRTLYGWWRPNRFFELLFVVFRALTVTTIGPIRNVPPGKLIFTPRGIFFVREVEQGGRIGERARGANGKSFHASLLPLPV